MTGLVLNLCLTIAAAGWEEELALANRLRDAGEARAEAAYRAAATNASGPPLDYAASATVANNFGLFYLQGGRYAEAASVLHPSLAIFDQGLYSNDDLHSAILHNASLAYRALGRRAESLSCLRRAIAKLESSRGPSDAALVEPLSALGAALTEAGLLDQAQTAVRRSLKIGAATHGRDSADLVPGYISLSEIERQTGNYDEAQRHAMRAVQIAGQQPSSTGIVTALNQLARLQWTTGSYPAATRNFEKAFELMKPHRTKHDPGLLKIRASLGQLYALTGNRKGARETLDAVVRDAEIANVNNVLAVALQYRAGLAKTQKELEAAEQHLKRSLAITDRETGVGSAQAAACLEALVTTLLDRKKPAEAELFSRRASEIAMGNESVPAIWVDILVLRAKALSKLKRKAEAVATAQRADTLKAALPSGYRNSVGISELSTGK